MTQSIERSACGKVILCGEHAVVYGRPAIALPLPHMRAWARIVPSDDSFKIVAPDIGQVVETRHSPSGDVPGASLREQGHNPLALISHLTLQHTQQESPRATLTITSDIPVGTNLGSGAAVSVAIARAIAAWFDVALPPEEASALAFEVEKLHHGTPSGIDNTVIAYEQAVLYAKGTTPAMITPHPTLSPEGRGLLLIADTGHSTPTRIPVGDVRAAWEKDTGRYEAIFDDIAAVVQRARAALLMGDWSALGAAMNDNHALLQQLTVSSQQLDHLCQAARAAGALGAKMSGGGRGGNMIALARDAEHVTLLKDALLRAGAKRIIA